MIDIIIIYCYQTFSQESHDNFLYSTLSLKGIIFPQMLFDHEKDWQQSCVVSVV